jgi:16S rRNA (guanine1516-N2)-methyltransferase
MRNGKWKCAVFGLRLFPLRSITVPASDIVISATTEALQSVAQQLSRTLGLPAMDPTQAADGHRFTLLVLPYAELDYQLALQQTGSRDLPLSLHFSEGTLAHRRKYGGGRKQPLARAIGIKPGHCPSVVDATAGLARDAFVLACLGCRVHMLERSPVIAALVEDGLRRARQEPETAAILSGKLQLSTGDARQLLTAIDAADREVIYLDPMYPPRSKSALVKKEMRILRALVGDDSDTTQLLEIALQQARKRVVVKRPRLAEPLQGPPPSTTVQSKNTRYDIYLRHSK